MYISICIYMYILCMYVCMHVCMYACMHVYVCVLHACMYPCIFVGHNGAFFEHEYLESSEFGLILP